ncbi:MAG: hypothetical protein QM664_15410, partial [Flavihumibacter sp.]
MKYGLLCIAGAACLFAFLSSARHGSIDAVTLARYKAGMLQNVRYCFVPAYVPENFLVSDISQKTGIGRVDYPISTGSSEAQDYFNQGMAFFYNFEYVQAARSFHKARRLDSTAAMICVGLSGCYDALSDSNTARNYAAEAVMKSNSGTQLEKDIVRIYNRYIQPAYDSAAIDQAREYVLAGIDSMKMNYANDANAWLFIAEMRNAFRRNNEKRRYCDSLVVVYLKKALQLKPDHFGAVHLLVHGNESLSRFTDALQFGEQYTKLAPEIPHAWHMYAHDLMKTGRIDEAIEKFNIAFSLEKKKYREEHMPAHYDWHHPHNLELLAYCYQYKGQFSKAEEIFSQLDTLTAFMEDAEGYIRKGHPGFLLQNGSYDEAIRLSEKIARGKGPANQLTGYLSTGIGYMLKKDVAAAERASALATHVMDSLKKVMRDEGASEEQIADGSQYFDGIQSLITIGLALQKDPLNTSLQAPIMGIQQAMLKQTGPDPWIDALYFLQLLTNITYSSGNMELAEGSARAMIQHDPEYGGGHLWLAKILLRQGKNEAADRERALAKKA